MSYGEGIIIGGKVVEFDPYWQPEKPRRGKRSRANKPERAVKKPLEMNKLPNEFSEFSEITVDKTYNIVLGSRLAEYSPEQQSPVSVNENTEKKKKKFTLCGLLR